MVVEVDGRIINVVLCYVVVVAVVLCDIEHVLLIFVVQALAETRASMGRAFSGKQRPGMLLLLRMFRPKPSSYSTTSP